MKEYKVGEKFKFQDMPLWWLRQRSQPVPAASLRVKLWKH